MTRHQHQSLLNANIEVCPDRIKSLSGQRKAVVLHNVGGAMKTSGETDASWWPLVLMLIAAGSVAGLVDLIYSLGGR